MGESDRKGTDRNLLVLLPHCCLREISAFLHVVLWPWALVQGKIRAIPKPCAGEEPRNPLGPNRSKAAAGPLSFPNFPRLVNYSLRTDPPEAGAEGKLLISEVTGHGFPEFGILYCRAHFLPPPEQRVTTQVGSSKVMNRPFSPGAVLVFVHRSRKPLSASGAASACPHTHFQRNMNVWAK